MIYLITDYQFFSQIFSCINSLRTLHLNKVIYSCQLIITFLPMNITNIPANFWTVDVLNIQLNWIYSWVIFKTQSNVHYIYLLSTFCGQLQLSKVIEIMKLRLLCSGLHLNGEIKPMFSPYLLLTLKEALLIGSTFCKID